MVKQRRRRILLVTRNMPPLLGGMERLNWHMAAELSRTAEVRVIAPKGSAVLGPPGVRITEVPLRPLWRFLASVSWRSLREARAWRPDLVLAGSGLTALPALIAARAVHAQAAVYAHGLDLAVPHWAYRRLWLPAVRAMDRVIANSRATAALAQQAGVDPTRIGIVHPGVELPAHLPDAEAVTNFRREHGLNKGPLLLSVGRLSTRKGLLEFVNGALPPIAAVFPDVVLLIVGDTPSDALHARAQTPQSIMAAAKSHGLEGNVRFLGAITDYGSLGQAYAAADLHVFPVREVAGDPEGFGMVAVESAAHGVQTVAFATGGVVDAIAEGHSGRLVASGDYTAMAEAILQALTQTDDVMRERCRAFARRFAWSEFGHQITAQIMAAMRPSNFDEAVS